MTYDATRRGNLYLRTTLIRSCHQVWLASGDLDTYRQTLAQASWAPPAGRYHMQHWYAFRAEHELELFSGHTGDLMTAALPGFEALRKSLLLRPSIIRNDANWLRGRLALVSDDRWASAPHRLKVAGRIARLLEREDDSYARVAGQLMRAAIAAQQGRTELAVPILTTASAVADDSGLLLHAAAARRRRGELVGGD